jgi:hypothetical protein
VLGETKEGPMMSGTRFHNDQETGETTNGGYLVKSKIHLDASSNREKGEQLDATLREGDCFLRHADGTVKVMRENRVDSEKLEYCL